jgi:dihydrofolate reductase
LPKSVTFNPSDGTAISFGTVVRQYLQSSSRTRRWCRATYDDWSAFWPNSDIEPFATFINGVEKFVASSTTPGRTWTNTTVIDGDLLEFVTELKRQAGGDIGVHGSIALTQSLLEGGLVDELRLYVAPVLHMHGRKLFDNGLSRS